MPEAALQFGGIMLEGLLDAEVVIQHGVKNAPVQIPLQRLGQHEALAQPRDGHIQCQHTLSQQNPLFKRANSPCRLVQHTAASTGAPVWTHLVQHAN